MVELKIAATFFDLSSKEGIEKQKKKYAMHCFHHFLTKTWNNSTFT